MSPTRGGRAVVFPVFMTTTPTRTTNDHEDAADGSVRVLSMPSAYIVLWQKVY